MSASRRGVDASGRDMGVTASIVPLGGGYDYVRETYSLVGAFGETTQEVHRAFATLDDALAWFVQDAGMEIVDLHP